VNWAMNFFQQSSGRGTYFPHVTLGASSDAMEQVKMDAPLPQVIRIAPRADDAAQLQVVVARMGNFCSCNTILFSVPL
jgi:hypothetical protein